MSHLFSMFSKKKKEVNMKLDTVRALWSGFIEQLKPELEKIIDGENVLILTRDERKKLLKLLNGIIRKQSKEFTAILMRLEIANSKLCCTRDGETVTRLKLNINNDIDDINELMQQLPELLIRSYRDYSKLQKMINKSKKSKKKFNNKLKKYSKKM